MRCGVRHLSLRAKHWLAVDQEHSQPLGSQPDAILTALQGLFHARFERERHRAVQRKRIATELGRYAHKGKAGFRVLGRGIALRVQPSSLGKVFENPHCHWLIVRAERPERTCRKQEQGQHRDTGTVNRERAGFRASCSGAWEPHGHIIFLIGRFHLFFPVVLAEIFRNSWHTHREVHSRAGNTIHEAVQWSG